MTTASTSSFLCCYLTTLKPCVLFQLRAFDDELDMPKVVLLCLPVVALVSFVPFVCRAHARLVCLFVKCGCSGCALSLVEALVAAGA